MKVPTHGRIAFLGGSTTILLVVGLLAIAFGPHPGFLLHRLLPFESGPAAAVGLRYELSDTDLWLASSDVVQCVDEGSDGRCRYVVHVRRPGDINESALGRTDIPVVDEPMIWLERLRDGRLRPAFEYPEVVAAAGLPEGLEKAQLLDTGTGVVALGLRLDGPGTPKALAAWKVDTLRWRLSTVSPPEL